MSARFSPPTDSCRHGSGSPIISRAAEVLTRSGFTVEPLAGRLLKVSLSNQQAWILRSLRRLLADQGLYVSELTPIQPDLESVFLNLTAGDH